MTAIVGCLTGEAAFVFADAALSFRGAPTRVGRTTTGGAQGKFGDWTIEEDAWKLAPVGASGIVGFAGRVDDGIEVVHHIVHSVVAGHAPGEVFRAAARSTSVDLLYAFTEGTTPRLLSASGGEIVEAQKGVPIVLGSLPLAEADYMGRLVADALRHPDADTDDARCALAVATLVTSTEGRDLMPLGVGGAWSGAYVRDRRYWQPDILFLPDAHDDRASDPFHTMVRDDLFIVGSNNTSSTQYAFPRPAAWLQHWGDFFQNYFDYGRFDYVAIWSPTRRVTVLLHMAKHRVQREFALVPDGDRMRSFLSDRLRSFLAMTPDGNCAIVPYSRHDTRALTAIDAAALELYARLPPDEARRQLDILIRASPEETKLDEE